jgi:hypothetical protein
MAASQKPSPRAQPKYGWLWLQVDRYPQAEEAHLLARSSVPNGMELRDWSLSPEGDHWSLFVQWRAPRP